MSSALFDDIFTVQTVDNGRYNKVSRIIGVSTTNSAIKLTLDINNEMFPVSQDDSLTVTLANFLSLDGEDDATNSNKSWRPPKPTDKSLADDYDYVMFGTVYKFEEGDEDKIKVYVSFGGLLMCLEGGYKSLASLKQDNLYILIRR